MRKFKNEQTGHIINEKDNNFELVVKLPKILIENSKDWVEIFEPKFKNGDFVKFGKAIVLILDYEENDGYGIDGLGEWKNTGTWTFKQKPHLWQLATKEEYVEALTKEAVKRGFKGNKIKADWIAFDGISNYLINGTFELRFNEFGYQMHKEYYTLMKDGIWAEVIKEETLDELADRFKNYLLESEENYERDFTTFFNENKETIHRLSK